MWDEEICSSDEEAIVIEEPKQEKQRNKRENTNKINMENKNDTKKQKVTPDKTNNDTNQSGTTDQEKIVYDLKLQILYQKITASKHK